MKKLLSLVLAAATALTMATAVFADAPAAENSDPATFTFDTDGAFSYIHTFGNAADTNLTYTLSDTGAIYGRCLKLSEDFSSEISNQYGGIYFDASDFGLDSFAGYTLKLNIKTTSATAKQIDNLLLFSDGEQWIAQNVSATNVNKWTTVSVSAPTDKRNTKLGVSIPIMSPFSGDVVFIDDVTITDNYGKMIANVGDIDTSLAEAPNTFVSVLTTILFIVLILVVIGGVAFVVLKLTRRFR